MRRVYRPELTIKTLEEPGDGLAGLEEFTPSHAPVVLVDEAVGHWLLEANDDQFCRLRRLLDADRIRERRQIAFLHDMDHVAAILLNIRDSLLLNRVHR